MGWIHTHQGYEPVLSNLSNLCTLNTIDQTLWSIVLDKSLAVGVV